MRILFAPEAEAEFAALMNELVDGERRDAATKLGARVFEIIDKLGRGEFEGPQVTLRSGKRVHTWPVPPVRLYYERLTGGLRVLHVHHQARAPIERDAGAT